jgi:hypothetical protein
MYIHVKFPPPLCVLPGVPLSTSQCLGRWDSGILSSALSWDARDRWDTRERQDGFGYRDSGTTQMSLDAFSRLRRVAAALRACEPLEQEDASHLAGALEEALDEGVDLDVALGLIQPSPLSPQALEQRAVLIERLAKHYHGSVSGRAKAMARDAVHYASTCWPRLRHAYAPPSHHLGKPEKDLFLLHHNHVAGGAQWPLSWRSLVDCLQSLPIAAANPSEAESGSG